ncbi:WD40 repeat-like protein [Anaeromyces robustus]|uniref:WD40 repeat-like protein n=1 Tax=Anaeromyces robustus TaxID=1754192 RepID=A0A1Y1XQT2_9FUNG|nr:WD40 repeat-like protein [Anaeromyces robustus]|eukprot:ORX87674.1 WD40 repeat-like protein [Anaeromyces robustus]
MGRRKKADVKLKKVKKEEEEDIELKPVKKEDDWEDDLNIINRYIEAIEGQCSSTSINNEQENYKNILSILNKKQYNYRFNSYEMGTETPKSFTKSLISKQYKQMDISKNIEIKHTHKGPVNALTIDFIENKYMLSVGIDANILLYDLDDRQIENPFSTSQNDNIKIIKPMATVNRDEKHKFSITNICWYPIDNGMFTTSSMDHTLKVWDTNNMKSIFQFKFDGPVFNHAFSPIAQTHNLIATGTTSSYVILCDLRSGSQSHILIGHKNPVVGLDWSPSNEYLLASGSGDHTIRLWDIRKPKSCLTSLCQYNSGDKIDEVTAHNGTVNALKFLSDGSEILSVGTDSKIHLWNIGNEKNVNTMLDFGSELSNTTEKVIFPAVTNLNECHPFLFQPSEDNDILVYNLYEAELIKRLKGHFRSVNCAVIRNGYQELYSSGNDSEIIQWTPIEVNINTEEEDEEQNNWSDDDDDFLF